MRKFYLNWPNEKKRSCVGIITCFLWVILLLLLAVLSLRHIILVSIFIIYLLLSITALAMPVIYAKNNYFWYNDKTDIIVLHIYRMKPWEIPLSRVCTLEETQNRDYSKGAVSGRANTVYGVTNTENDVLFYVNGADPVLLDFFKSRGIPIVNSF